MPESLILLAGLTALNAWATKRLLAADHDAYRKTLAITMVWICPVIGIFFASQLVPLTRPATAETPAKTHDTPPDIATPTLLQLAADAQPFTVPDHLHWSEGIPLLDADALRTWAESHADSADQAKAWMQGRRAWLLHLRDALGAHYHLHESEHALVLSALDARDSTAIARQVETTRKRIAHVLDGVARFAPEEKSLVLLVDDEDTYYRYVATWYPEEGEFAYSGGMFIDAGCPHFVTTQRDPRSIEAVIAHEMTHSSVAHLRLPTWVDEGIAVNTEQRLVGAAPRVETPQQLQGMHRKFWNAATVQEFWAGTSFHRTDEGNKLSYELARILVDSMSRDWPAFVRFARAARREDAGAAAASECMGMELGAAVCALMEQPQDAAWSPQGANQAVESPASA